MSAKPPPRQAPRAKPVEDRGAAPVTDDTHGSLRWVRDVLGRSIRQDQRPHPSSAGHGELRRGAAADSAHSLLIQQRAELGARLLVHDPATQPVRNLLVVHDQLGGSGWSGVEALPPKVLGRALKEAEILSSDEPSPLLATIIEQLRELTVVADERLADAALERELQREFETLQIPEVSETNYDEYELMERSWVGTVPAGLELPDRGY